MHHTHPQFGRGFRAVVDHAHARAVRAALEPGEAAGGPDDRHPGTDLWLYVVSGSGVAVVDGERIALRAGTLVLVERGERHEVRNTGAEPLRTISVYVPPARPGNGLERPAGLG
jgi:mannose-6-phosphate isomerase-like protein (cupin superfamily)